MNSDRSFFTFLLFLAALFAVVVTSLLLLASAAVGRADDFRERCEAAGGRTISTRLELLCMKKEQFVEVGHE
jgi:hypothetical protein